MAILNETKEATQNIKNQTHFCFNFLQLHLPPWWQFDVIAGKMGENRDITHRYCFDRSVVTYEVKDIF